MVRKKAKNGSLGAGAAITTQDYYVPLGVSSPSSIEQALYRRLIIHDEGTCKAVILSSLLLHIPPPPFSRKWVSRKRMVLSWRDISIVGLLTMLFFDSKPSSSDYNPSPNNTCEARDLSHQLKRVLAASSSSPSLLSPTPLHQHQNWTHLGFFLYPDLTKDQHQRMKQHVQPSPPVVQKSLTELQHSSTDVPVMKIAQSGNAEQACRPNFCLMKTKHDKVEGSNNKNNNHLGEHEHRPIPPNKGQPRATNIPDYRS